MGRGMEWVMSGAVLLIHKTPSSLDVYSQVQVDWKHGAVEATAFVNLLDDPIQDRKPWKTEYVTGVSFAALHAPLLG